MQSNPEKSVWLRIKEFITNPKVLLFLLCCIVFLNLFDAGVSWWVISAGYAYELNPFMAFLMSISYPLFFAVKFVIGIILYKICRPKLHEKPVITIILILFSIYSLLGIYNLYGGITVALQMLGIITI